MKQDNIIKLAKEAWGDTHEIFWFDDDGIQRFAALVAAAEREACAVVCENIAGSNKWSDAAAAATAIRARSNNE